MFLFRRYSTLNLKLVNVPDKTSYRWSYGILLVIVVMALLQLQPYIIYIAWNIYMWQFCLNVSMVLSWIYSVWVRMAVDKDIFQRWWSLSNFHARFKNIGSPVILKTRIINGYRLIHDVKLFFSFSIIRVPFVTCWLIGHDAFRLWWLWCRLIRNAFAVIFDLACWSLISLILHPGCFQIWINLKLWVAFNLSEIPAFFNLRKIRGWFPPYYNLFFLHNILL